MQGERTQSSADAMAAQTFAWTKGM